MSGTARSTELGPVRETLRAALRGAKVKVFDGLGHYPFWEDPAGVATQINGFLTPGGARAVDDQNTAPRSRISGYS